MEVAPICFSQAVLGFSVLECCLKTSAGAEEEGVGCEGEEEEEDMNEERKKKKKKS